MSGKGRYSPVTNSFLIIIVILILAYPLFTNRGNRVFRGTDEKAAEVIKKENPGIKPWFNYIWEPGSSEVASLLFSLQAAAGSGIVFYVIGYYRGKRERDR